MVLCRSNAAAAVDDVVVVVVVVAVVALALVANVGAEAVSIPWARD